MAKEKSEEESKTDITAEYSELYNDRSAVLKTGNRFQNTESGQHVTIPVGRIDFLHDITMHLLVEFGHTRLSLGEVLNMKKGHVIKVNKLLGEPVSVHAGEVLIARGEIVIVNERLGIRVTEVIRPQEKAIVDATPDLE